jgi:hypothetical protein
MSPTPSDRPSREPTHSPTPSHDPTHTPPPSRESTRSREPTHTPTPSNEPVRTPAPSNEPAAESDLRHAYSNLPSDTHAERHPNLPCQEVRVLTKKKLTEAQKATRALRLISDQEKNALLTKDLEALLITQNKGLEDLAKKHAVKVEYVQNLVQQSSHFKKKRAVNLRNALLHHKAVEVNSGMSLIQSGVLANL